MTKIGHFATRFLTKPKEMGTIWTSRFEDKSLNFIAGYIQFYLSRISTTPWPRPYWVFKITIFAKMTYF